MAIFQTLSFKRRKQQNDIDSPILIKFSINLCSTMATVLFGSAAFLTIYIYILYKTQRTVKILPPFEELKMIKFFFVLAFILKVWAIRILLLLFTYSNQANLFQSVKFGHHLAQQINCDLFFIDWERPRVFEHQITLKSTNNLDTPSICSSVSLTNSQFRCQITGQH